MVGSGLLLRRLAATRRGASNRQSRNIRPPYTSRSNSSTSVANWFSAASTAAGCSMSTPASRSRSSGSFEQPPLRKSQIVVEFLAAAAEHAVGQGDRGRHAGGVLVDVERPVEVRDPQAFQVQLVVEREVGAEVELQQLAVDLLEAGRASAARPTRPRRGSASRTRRTSSAG